MQPRPARTHAAELAILARPPHRILSRTRLPLSRNAFNQILMNTKKLTPAELGFRMPPEWHPHAATWLTWPKDPHLD